MENLLWFIAGAIIFLILVREFYVRWCAKDHKKKEEEKRRLAKAEERRSLNERLKNVASFEKTVEKKGLTSDKVEKLLQLLKKLKDFEKEVK